MNPLKEADFQCPFVIISFSNKPSNNCMCSGSYMYRNKCVFYSVVFNSINLGAFASTFKI